MSELRELYNKLRNNKKAVMTYEIVIAGLSLGAVGILILEFSSESLIDHSSILTIMDEVIIGIFALDYFTRLYLSENKIIFVRKNIIDLISIIPFNSIFQAARVLRITRALKFLRLVRIFVFLGKFKKYADSFIKTNNFNYIVWITIFTLIAGTIGIHYVENIAIGNALWWSFVTITTVGYGDISPSTPVGRFIAVVLMLVGIGFLSMLTGTIATFFLNIKQKKSVRDEVIDNIQGKLENFDELTLEDIDDIYNILKGLKAGHN